MPWLDTAPSFTPVNTPTPEPMPTDVPACRARALRATDGFAQGAGAFRVGAAILTNTLSAPCLPHGYTTLTFVDA
ncbi:MAG: hypothetical protein HY071_07135 [Chloroflexi bacterium]|nr:hypothetical protein [Chloroflexota bacterium]